MKQTLFAVALFIAVSAQGQLLDFGVKGGVNFPTLKLDGNTQISDITTTTGTGFHAGAMLRINLLLIYLQPELIYTNTNTDFSFKVNGGATQNSTYNMQRLDVPIQVGFKLGPVSLFGAPVASFNLSSPDDIFNDTYKTATWGYQLGAGVKLLKFLAEVKFEGPFSDYAQGAEYAGQVVELDARQHMFILSFGYFF
jgi:hypothetical protein